MFVVTNDAVLWCNQMIKNEVANIVSYTHALEIGLIALLIGVVLVEINRMVVNKKYVSTIEKLKSENDFLKAEMLKENGSGDVVE